MRVNLFHQATIKRYQSTRLFHSNVLYHGYWVCHDVYSDTKGDYMAEYLSIVLGVPFTKTRYEIHTCA